MASSISASAKKRGRPVTTGTPRTIGVRIHDAELDSLDAYIAAQPDPKPSRPEAIRVGLREWLTGLGHLPTASAESTSDPPQPADPSDRYADADPDEAVMVTGVGPMILRRAVRKLGDWRDHHGLGLVSVYRGADKQPAMFDMADLGRLAEMERFR